MNTIKQIKDEYKKFFEEIVFIELRTNDEAFDFIDKNTVVPVYIPTVVKDKESQSINISMSDVVFGIGLLSYEKTTKSLLEFLESCLKKSKNFINHIEYKKEIDPLANYFYLNGLNKMLHEIDADEEIICENLRLLSISERFILENYEIENVDEILKEYRKHLSYLYEKNKDGKYIYYLGKSYEADGDTLRARLLYTKGLEESNKNSDDWEEVKDAIDNAYKTIFDKSEMERAAYLLSYNKYEEAIEIIDKLPESIDRTKLKINALYNMGENEQIIKEIDRFEEIYGIDMELEEIKKLI